nr:MAG TPA: hypothetical protein [Caudoviricetes sp.]
MPYMNNPPFIKYHNYFNFFFQGDKVKKPA